MSRRVGDRSLVLFAFVVCAFVVLALLQQKQQVELARIVEGQEKYVQAQCEQRLVNVQRSNDRLAALLAVELRAEAAGDEYSGERADIYREQSLDLPLCQA